MEFDIVALVLRWMHILAASAAVGGTIFMRLALLPAAVSTLPDDQHRSLREAIRSRWAPIVMAAIAFLLISGFYNYLVYSTKLDIPRPYRGIYHGLFGVKFILAFIVFFLASALVGRSPAMDRFRQQAKLWQSLNLALVVIIVLISGVLRTISNAARSAPHAPPAAASAFVDEMSFAAGISSDYAGETHQ
ncbi:MAG: hypothetical protein HY000_27920 [Planctomycetes bacterium]|nr:hypothetical protein [Planctomycetota bacterium]